MKKISLQRWEAALKLFNALKESALREKAFIGYDNKQIIKPENIVIDEKTIHVRLTPTCRIRWFELDEEWDHGVFTPIKEYEKDFRERFHLCKIIPF